MPNSQRSMVSVVAIIAIVVIVGLVVWFVQRESSDGLQIEIGAATGTPVSLVIAGDGSGALLG